MGTSKPMFVALAWIATVLAGPSAWAKRAEPTPVDPVVSGNVRYEAPHLTNPCDPDQAGGCVVAYDNTSNAQLWAVQVYCTKYDPDMEEDVQWVFINSLTLSSSGQLQVANEDGKHFTIDPKTQKVSGEATGCSEKSSGGCSYAPPRSVGPTLVLFAVMGLLGLLGARRLHVLREKARARHARSGAPGEA